MIPDACRVNPTTSLPLYWRICLINGLVFVAGTAALAISPATVSSRVLPSEVVVLAVGLVVILATNALLVRTSLAPLDRLIKLMGSVDVRRPGRRLPEQGSGSVAILVRAFNAMLTRLENERGASNAMALAAQEAERHRIAQELHDEVGQRLTAILLGLKRVVDQVPADVAEDVLAVQDAARASLEEVRQVSRRLRPGVLEDLGLVSALSALATEFSTYSSAHVRRGFSRGLPKMSAETELVIYRVAQEALTNVARHADAKNVELTLGRQGDGVLLQVADDGRGLHGWAEGAGVRGMRERAMLVGGHLDIGPRVGGGTEVRLLVPSPARP
jgi:two-component system, NarL family, sensor histidine kinase UhpB